MYFLKNGIVVSIRLTTSVFYSERKTRTNKENSVLAILNLDVGYASSSSIKDNVTYRKNRGNIGHDWYRIELKQNANSSKKRGQKKGILIIHRSTNESRGNSNIWHDYNLH